MRTTYWFVVWMLLAFFLAACQNNDALSDPPVEGRLLIWHTFNSQQEAVFDMILADFVELYPDVKITDEHFSLDALESAFPKQAAAGLGPDMVILPTSHVGKLAEMGLLRDVSKIVGSDSLIDSNQFLAGSLDMLHDGDNLFGVPLSLSTFGLYYNKASLGALPTSSNDDDESADPPPAIQPPTTLDALLEQAADGQQIGIPSRFYSAFWGVQTFGGQLLDGDGRVILNQNGFVEWLTWLKQAQDTPNVVVSRRSETLLDLFVAGHLSYYVGSSDALSDLQTAMGAEQLGVVRLPRLDDKDAGPFLEVNALLFSQASVERSANAAVYLAEFLTNVEQQTVFALSAGLLPANEHVRIDPTIAPLIAELTAQAHTSVPIALVNRPLFDDVVDLGNMLNGQFLTGETTAAEAADTLTKQINDQYGFDTLE